MWMILGTMLGLMISFFVSWLVYHLGGRFVVFGGVSKDKSLALAAIETFYVAMVFMFSFIPLGFIIGGIMSLLLPFLMIKAIKKQYEVGLPIALMVFVVAAVVKFILFLPYYLL